MSFSVFPSRTAVAPSLLSPWKQATFSRRKFSLDDLLTNVMIYWTTGCIASSMRFYKENFGKGLDQPHTRCVTTETDDFHFQRCWSERAAFSLLTSRG